MATEKRLIDANVLIESGYDVTLDEVFPDWFELPESVQEAVCKHGKYLKKLIQQQPTIDAVEVVRCKDCKFRKSTFNGDGYFCSVWDTDDYEEAYVKDNDFCSYGERKDNE